LLQILKKRIRLRAKVSKSPTGSVWKRVCFSYNLQSSEQDQKARQPMNKLNHCWKSLLALALALVFGSGSGRADYTFDLGNGNTGINGYSGPYVRVDVNLTSSTTATVTFTSLTNNGNIFLMGDGGTVGLNVNATSFGLKTSDVTLANPTGFTAGSVTSIDSGNEDGFGNFNLRVNTFDGFSHSDNKVTLTNLTNLSGTWASAQDVLTTNAGGSLAGAHIFVTTDPANVSNGALATGYAANGLQVAPAPGSAILMGMGGIGLIAFVQRSRRRQPERHAA
jgi:hypothetical protein